MQEQAEIFIFLYTSYRGQCAVVCPQSQLLDQYEEAHLVQPSLVPTPSQYPSTSDRSSWSYSTTSWGMWSTATPSRPPTPICPMWCATPRCGRRRSCAAENALKLLSWQCIDWNDLKIHCKETPNKCSQLNYGRWFEDSFEIPIGEKPKNANMSSLGQEIWGDLWKCTMNCIGEKCNQCKYEKLNKCNLREFASSRSCHLRTHFKNTPEKSQTHVMSVTFHPARQKIWPDIWIDTVVEKSQKYNQCEYEKLNKCNLCDFAFSR